MTRAATLQYVRDGLADAMFMARRGTPRVHVNDRAVAMTDRMLVRHYYDTGAILYCPDRPVSIWGPSEVNQAFRTWHDYCHILSGLCEKDCGPLGCFEPEAEFVIARQQCRGLSDGLAAVVWEEVYGQNRYYAEHGHLVEDQIGFALKWLGYEQ